MYCHSPHQLWLQGCELSVCVRHVITDSDGFGGVLVPTCDQVNTHHLVTPKGGGRVPCNKVSLPGVEMRVAGAAVVMGGLAQVGIACPQNVILILSVTHIQRC